MKRKTKWILGLSAGIPVLLFAGLLLVLHFTSPNPESALSSVKVKEFPSAWTQEPSRADLESVSTTSEMPDEAEPVAQAIIQPAIENLGLPLSGTLVMMGNNRPFGEEAFELSLEEDEVLLRSNGRFWFKALIATLTITFEQTLQMDSYLRPVRLSSSLAAPLGFDRDTQAEFKNMLATVRSGDDISEFPVDLDRAFVLGTFSTYAVIPLLYTLRNLEGEVSMETLVFGGPPNRDAAATDTLPVTRINRVEDAMIRFDEQVLSVSQYEISGDMGTMRLYARGVELLGLFSGSDEESLFVYRADYFEDGFEIVE